MTTLPADLPKGKIVGRFLILSVDTPDDGDRYPDPQPAVGAITLTLQDGQVIRSTSTSEPVTIIVEPLTYTFDMDGYVIDAEDQQGAWVPCGKYRVSASLQVGALKDFEIEVLPTHDDLNPLDLTEAAA